MDKQKGIASTEALEKLLKIEETLLLTRIKKIQITEDAKYGSYWETFIARDVGAKLLYSPKAIFDKWVDIKEDRKAEWVEQAKTANQIRTQFLGLKPDQLER